MQAKLRLQHTLAQERLENTPEVQSGMLRSGFARHPSRSSTLRTQTSRAQLHGQADVSANILAPGLPIPNRLCDLLHKYVRLFSHEYHMLLIFDACIHKR